MFICYSCKYCRETSVCRAVCTFSSLKFVWTLLFVFQFESQSSNCSVKLCASLASSQQLSVNQYYYCICLCNICFLNEATCGCSCQTDTGSKPIWDEWTFHFETKARVVHEMAFKTAPVAEEKKLCTQGWPRFSPSFLCVHMLHSWTAYQQSSGQVRTCRVAF